MNIINKTRLIHLGNTSLFTKETTLSPKFWAKCATVVSSLAMMEDASAGTRTINVDSGTATIGTKFSGSNNFVKSGEGTLVLNYDNTTTTDPEPLSAAFTGQTSVTGGTLALQRGGALGTGGTLTMAANTTLQAYASITVPNAIVLGGDSTIQTTEGSNHNTLTLSGGIAENGGARTLTVAGAGTLVLNNTSTHEGGTTLGGTSKLKITHANAIPATGALTLGGGTTLEGSTSASINALTLSGNATVTVDESTTLTATGAVTGGFTLTKSTGTGTLVLTGTNSSGDTNLTISAGTVSVAADANIPGGTLRLNGGKLHTSASYTSSKNFTMENHSEIGSSGVLTYSGTIMDADSAKTLTVSEGTVALNGDYHNNTHTNLTVANGATLRIEAADNLTGGSLTLSGTLKTITNSFATGKNIAVSTAGILDVANTTTLTASGVISGAATLNKNTGTGTLVLTGANSASATTDLTITTGVVSVAADANIPGGTLRLNGGKLRASTGYTSTKAITMADDGYIGAESGHTLTYNGAITDAGTHLLTIDSGTVELSGTNTGVSTNLTVGSATLRIGAADNLTDGTLTLNGGTLNTTATFASSKAIALTDNSSLDVAATTTLTASGAISGATHTLEKTSAGTLVLAGANSGVATNLTITTGVVSVAADANIPGGTLRLNGGKLYSTGAESAKSLTMVLDSSIGSSGTLTYSGTIMDAASPKTLTVSEGTVALNANYSDNTHTNLIVANGATLRIDAANNLIGGSLTLNGGTLKTAGDFASDKAIALTANSSLDVAATTTLTASGAISGATHTLEKTSAGTLVLAGANSGVATNLTISAGTVSIDAADKLPGGTLTLNAGSTLLSTAGSSVTLTSPANVVIGGNAALNVGTQHVGTQPMTINKVVSGSGVLTKAGGAKLTLGVSNTHTGGIIVNAGSLALADNHAAGTGTITLGAGTALFGSTSGGGAYDNDITLTGNATLTATSNTTASGDITGGFNLTINDDNSNKTVTLSGSNTYSGTTTLGGAVILNIGNSASISSAALIMGDSTTLVLAGGVTLPCGIQF
jgi:fibronectin-binding autotransporter adhesin